MTHVDDVHPRAHHKGSVESGLPERVEGDRESRVRLLVRVA
jgi:hypothetical protein